MNLNESLRDWIQHRLPVFPALEDIDIVTMGEMDELAPPFLGIYETGSEPFEQGNTPMRGISTVEITVELHTVPAEDGTSTATEQAWRRDLYHILGDQSAIDWMHMRNGWLVFDIRLAAPTTEASEGRRISRWILSIVAGPT